MLLSASLEFTTKDNRNLEQSLRIAKQSFSFNLASDHNNHQ